MITQIAERQGTAMYYSQPWFVPCQAGFGPHLYGLYTNFPNCDWISWNKICISLTLYQESMWCNAYTVTKVGRRWNLNCYYCRIKMSDQNELYPITIHYNPCFFKLGIAEKKDKFWIIHALMRVLPLFWRKISKSCSNLVNYTGMHSVTHFIKGSPAKPKVQFF